MYFKKVADDVIAFHKKFGLKPISEGGTPSFKLRYDRLVEELDEINTALDEHNRGDFLDALVDIVYIAVGTLYLYDRTEWFNNEFIFPVRLGVEPCSWMQKFDTTSISAYIVNDEETHCRLLPSLVNQIFSWAATYNWPMDAAWDEVQKANMAKRRAKATGSDSKHGSGQDIVKPKGWVAPDIEKVIKQFINGGQLEMDV